MLILYIIKLITNMNKHPITTRGEIIHATDKYSADEFRDHMKTEFGIDGPTAHERIDQLKDLSIEGAAVLIEDVNKNVQGSADSLMSESAVRIGEQEGIQPENRYDFFCNLMNLIKNAPDTVNPARVADVFSLGIVILHAFQDGNGRTARTIGYMFRDNYTSDSYANDYEVVTESRDDVRKRGGFSVNGYIPFLPPGKNQSNSADALEYLSGLLTNESPNAYTGCFGQAPLRSDAPGAEL